MKRQFFSIWELVFFFAIMLSGPGASAQYTFVEECWKALGCNAEMCAGLPCSDPNINFCTCTSATDQPAPDLGVCQIFPTLCGIGGIPGGGGGGGSSELRTCPVGKTCDGQDVYGAVEGQPVCGTTGTIWECSSESWRDTNKPCDCPSAQPAPEEPTYSCTGTRCDGANVTTGLGETVCGTSRTVYECTTTGFQPQANSPSCGCPECPAGGNGTTGCPYAPADKCPNGADGSDQCPYPAQGQTPAKPVQSRIFEGTLPASHFSSIYEKVYQAALRKLDNPNCNREMSGKLDARATLAALQANGKINLYGGSTGWCEDSGQGEVMGFQDAIAGTITFCDRFFGATYISDSEIKETSSANLMQIYILHELAHATGKLVHPFVQTEIEKMQTSNWILTACFPSGTPPWGQTIEDMWKYDGPITRVEPDFGSELLASFNPLPEAQAVGPVTLSPELQQKFNSVMNLNCGTRPPADLNLDFFQVVKPNAGRMEIVQCPSDSTFTGCLASCDGVSSGTYPEPNSNGCRGGCADSRPAKVTTFCARNKPGRRISHRVLNNVERGTVARCDPGTTVAGCSGRCIDNTAGGTWFNGEGCELVCDGSDGGGTIAAHCISETEPQFTFQHSVSQGVASGNTLSCPLGSALVGGGSYCNSGRSQSAEVNGNGILSKCPAGYATNINQTCATPIAHTSSSSSGSGSFFDPFGWFSH